MESNPAESSSEVSDLASFNQLLDPYFILRAAKQVRQTGQPQIREQLRLLRQDIEQSRHSTRNPLHLFPLEIWLIILNNLEDIKNWTNLAQSNNILLRTLFTPQELLFCKVLPHLVPYLGDDPGPTILVCGKVCRKWRNSVDRFADHFFCVETPPLDAIDALVKDSVPHFPNKDTLNCTVETRNRPFLSIGRLSGFNARFSTLNDVSHCLWKVVFEVDPISTYRLWEIYGECVRAIGGCKNLKSFRLLNHSSHRVLRTYNGENPELELKPPSTLESLEIIDKDSGSGISAIQDILIQKLGNQLKRLVVYQWDSEMYHELQWPNLTELEILKKTDFEVLNSLEETTAPKLWKLHIHWNSRLNFVRLLLVVNKFERLRYLSILITEAVTDESITVPMELITSSRVTTLEVYSQTIYEDLKIVRLFPMLKNLVCHYGPKADKYGEFRRKIYPEKSYIPVFKNMYYSIVWKVLPMLETLTMSHETYSETSRQKFTRMGYIWATEKHAQAVQIQTNHIQKLQREFQRKKLKATQDDLEKSLRGIDLAKVTKKLNKAIQEMESPVSIKLIESFPLVIPHLTKSDLLSCRRLCKNLKIAVGESILDNCIKNIPLTFHVPLSSQQQLQSFVSFVEDNMRKPFFGRTVEIQIMEDADCVDGMEMMLTDLGKYIRHLTIRAEIPLELSNIYKVCVECMNQCLNLQSFSLRLSGGATNDCKVVFDGLRKFEGIATPKHLEALEFYRHNFTDTEKGLYALRNHLEDLINFSDPMKTLIVENINGETKLNALRELTVTNFKTLPNPLPSGVSWYGRASWPFLRKMRLCITQKELCCRDLLDIIAYCENLKFLELQFTNACFSFDKNLVHWEPSFARSVTEFQIVFKNKYQICLDFLVYFPYIQTLRIIYGGHAVLLNEDAGISERETKWNLPALEMRSPEYDFIHLAGYLKDENVAEHDELGIYSSKVWSVLSRLQILEIVYCAKKSSQDRKIFRKKH